MSCRSKTKPKKRTPCQRNNFCWTASGWTGKPMISNISTNWKDSDSSDTGWSYWIHPIWILNFQNFQDSPLRHRTPRHLPRFRWEIPPIPFRLSRTQRSGALAPSSPIQLPERLSRSVAVCFMASATTCSSEAAPRRCRGCAVRVELEMGITDKTQTVPRAKQWFKNWNHLRHLLLQEPNTSLQCMWSNYII